MPFIQRSSRTLSFKPFIKTATRTHSNVTDETYHLYNTNGFLDDLSHVVQNSLAPGPRLDEQNMRTGNRVVVDVDALLDDTSGQPRQVMLLHWVRHAIVQASSCGVYGQNHPFLRPEVEEAYW